MPVNFVIALKPSAEWGMNRVYAGKHWSIRKAQAQQMHLIVKTAIRQQVRGARLFEKPVVVRIRYNSRLDIDNHGYLAKLIIDGMKGLLIEDDDRRFVKRLEQGFHAGARDLILVEVEEADADA